MAIKPEVILKRLEEIEARAKRATPGPWEIKHYKGRQGEAWWHSYYCRSSGKTVWGGLKRLTWDGEDPIPSDDLLFISNAREDVPWLCQVTRELLARLEQLEAVAKAARELLKFPPDSMNGEDWEWAWDQLYADSQEQVKAVRERARKALAALEEET